MTTEAGRGEEVVVLVHGIWLPGWPDMALLRRGLRGCGYRPRQFFYHSVLTGLDGNVDRLAAFLGRMDAPTVHFLCHSLGGLVVLRLFQRFPEQRPGRIVTLGTPHRGSAVARSLARHGWGRAVLGRAREALTGPGLPLPPGRQVGTIAGTLNLGVGRLLAEVPRPCDGTVCLEETRVQGQTAHLVLPVSHSGLLFSRRVAEAACAFLREGRFQAT